MTTVGALGGCSDILSVFLTQVLYLDCGQHRSKVNVFMETMKTVDTLLHIGPLSSKPHQVYQVMIAV